MAAAASSPESSAGVLFQKGQYAQAKALYLKAYQQNKSNPALIYNLAVVSYKLKQYKEARSYFAMLLSVPAYQFIARYNLALVDYKSGNTADAIKGFSQLVADPKASTESDKKIQSLAQSQLDLLSADSVKDKKSVATPQIKTYLASHLGYEDSLLDPLGLPVDGDNFLDLIGTVKIPLTNSDQNGLSLGLEFYTKDYASLTAYNYLQYGVSLTQSYPVENWLYSAGFTLLQSTYGPDDYLDTLRLDLKASYKMTAQSKTLLRFRYDDLSSRDTLFDPYDGKQQRFDMYYDWRQGAHRIKTGVALEWNNRQDYVSPITSDFTSYSATRNKLEFTWYYKFGDSATLRLNASGRSSEYNDLNTADGRVRNDQLDIVGIQLKSKISKNGWVELEHKQTDNQSNLSRYSYSRNITSIGVSTFF